MAEPVLLQISNSSFILLSAPSANALGVLSRACSVIKRPIPSGMSWMCQSSTPFGACPVAAMGRSRTVPPALRLSANALSVRSRICIVRSGPAVPVSCGPESLVQVASSSPWLPPPLMRAHPAWTICSVALSNFPFPQVGRWICHSNILL